MVRWRQVTRGGVRLACREMGGQGEAVLLMHGLAGHAEEWAETAAWLAGRRRVVALEARGHGRSGRRPDDVSRSALVGDAAYVIEKLGLAPVTVVGESLGGLIGLSLAARRPDLVRALVVVDASPEGGGDEVEQTVAAIVGALRQWPVPFRDRAEAEGFFAARFGGRLAAQAWTAGLEQRGGALWPRFEVEVMARILREAISEASWEEWERIGCPR